MSHCPRRGKLVLALSTQHQAPFVDEVSGKPEIIMAYNATKGGVDVLDAMIESFMGKPPLHRWPTAAFFFMLGVVNSAAFVEELQSLTISPEDRLVSFDVTSLFTRVPTAEAVDIICNKLDEDDTLAERCELSVQSIRFLMDECLKCSYFKCQERYFLQLEGASMGLSLSVVLANAYVEALYEKLLENATIKPKYYTFLGPISKS